MKLHCTRTCLRVPSPRLLQLSCCSGCAGTVLRLPDVRPAVQTMTLSNNDLFGQLPDAWGSSVAWSALVYLDISANAFNGTLPASWGDSGAPAAASL